MDFYFISSERRERERECQREAEGCEWEIERERERKVVQFSWVYMARVDRPEWGGGELSLQWPCPIALPQPASPPPLQSSLSLCPQPPYHGTVLQSTLPPSTVLSLIPYLSHPPSPPSLSRYSKAWLVGPPICYCQSGHFFRRPRCCFCV